MIWLRASLGATGRDLQSSFVMTGAWLEPKTTENPALISALCSVTKRKPCSGSGTLPQSAREGSWPGSPVQTPDLPQGMPWTRARWASLQRSLTSNNVTGMQSWSMRIRCFLGKTRHNAARTKVPAQVGWMFFSPLAELIGKKTRSHCSWAGPVNNILLFHQAATVGQWPSDSSVVVWSVRFLLPTSM